jgi:DNA-binding PadR family transcriptional regulator
MNITPSDDILPLTPQLLQILVALSWGPATGYGIMWQVSEDTEGRMKLHAGTVYPALKRLLQLHHVREIGDKLRPGRPSRRYQLTSLGKQTLEWELSRIEAAAQLGRQRLSDARLRGW